MEQLARIKSSGRAGEPLSVRTAVLAALAAVGDRGLSPGALDIRLVELGVTAATIRRHRAALVRSGLIAQTKAIVCLTAAGHAEARALPVVHDGTSIVVCDRAARLEEALDILSSRTLRAYLRLVLSGVVARFHLHRDHPSGWTCFVAYGAGGLGKTLVGKIVCRIFGLDEAMMIRQAATETERSLWGRREQQPGGGWVLRAEPALSFPFIVLDECDKANPDLMRSLFKLLSGETRIASEGEQVIDCRPTVLATLNKRENGTTALDRDYYQRRAVVLDFDALAPLLEKTIGAEADRLLDEPGTLPRLELSALRPADSLAEGVRQGMLHDLHAGLSDKGWRHLPRLGVQYLALGRAALLGCSEGEGAADTVRDYLACASTTGETCQPAGEAEAGEAANRQRQKERVQREAAEAVRLAAERAGLDERIKAAVRSITNVPAQYREEAARYRKGLAPLRQRIAEARSMQMLEALGELVEIGLAQVDQLRERLGRPLDTGAHIRLVQVSSLLALARPALSPPKMGGLGYGVACGRLHSLAGVIPAPDGRATCPVCGDVTRVPRHLLRTA